MNIRTAIIIIITCSLFDNKLVFSQKNISSNEIEKTAKNLQTHSDTHGQDSAYFNKLDYFGNVLTAYRKAQGYDSVYLKYSLTFAHEIFYKNPSRSFSIYNENIEKCKEIEDPRFLNMTYHELAKKYSELGYTDKAANLYLETASNFEAEEDWLAFGYSLIDIGNLYYQSNQIELAQSYYDKASNVFKKHLNGKDLNYSMSLYYNNCGLIKLQTSQPKDALNLFYKAYRLRQKNKLVSLNPQSYIHFVEAFTRMGHEDSARFYYKKAIENQINNNLSNDLIATYMQFGSFLLERKNIVESKAYILKAKQIALTNDFKASLTDIYFSLGVLSLYEKNLDSSLYYVTIADSFANVFHQRNMQENCVNALINIYERKGDFKKANELYKKSLQIRESNKNDDLLKKELKYQVEELRKSENFNQIIKKRNEIIIISYSLVTILLLFIIGISVAAWRRISKQKKELQSIIKHRDLTYSIIAHDLRNPIGGAINGLDMLKNFENLGPDATRKLVTLSHKALESSYLLLENLLIWSKFGSYDGIFHPEKISLSKTVSDSMTVLADISTKKRVEIKNEIEEGITLNADKNMLSAIFRNLVSNSLKFSESGKAITVKATQNLSKTRIQVIDQGIGIDEETIDRLLTSTDINESTHGTNMEKGSGLGLVIVKKFVKIHSGTLTIESKIGEGSRFIIELPN